MRATVSNMAGKAPVHRTKTLAIGLLCAVGLAVCGCGEHAGKTDEAKANTDLNQAGEALTTAVKKTGAALGHEADAAKPSLEAGVAKLADATGDAAAKAGEAMNKAGQKANEAAHDAGEDAREHADNASAKD